MTDVLLEDWTPEEILAMTEQVPVSAEVIEARTAVVSTIVDLADAMIADPHGGETGHLRELNFGQQQVYWSILSVEIANQVDNAHESSGDHHQAIQVGMVLAASEVVARHGIYQTVCKERFGRPSPLIAASEERAVADVGSAFRGLGLDRVGQVTKTMTIPRLASEVNMVRTVIAEAESSSRQQGGLVRRLLQRY